MRVLQLEDSIASSVCQCFEADGVVSSNCLRKGLFTVGAIDNLDHNPSSTTSVNSFHGTGISLFQTSTNIKFGESRQLPTLELSNSQNHVLRDSYASVPAVALKSPDIEVFEGEVAIDVQEYDTRSTKLCLDEAVTKEHTWIEHTLPLLEKKLTDKDAIAWAAYHAALQPPLQDQPVLCALLPLFYEKAATPTMIKHGMDFQKRATDYLNPGQIPVTTFDQPLFALAKFVQRKWSDTYGQQVHVVMLGGLHTDMALWNTLGDMLEGSGWTEALTEGEVASSGFAESFLKASHLTHTRHAHQVTHLAIQNLQREAFLLSKRTNTKESSKTWKNEMQCKSPTIAYWNLTMRYQILILLFVRAHRERNFSLYVEVLEELVPLFFALDHINYTRWVPVHIRDMRSLPSSIKDEFEKQGHLGSFQDITQILRNPF